MIVWGPDTDSVPCLVCKKEIPIVELRDHTKTHERIHWDLVLTEKDRQFLLACRIGVPE